jgi:hypothetical protein
MTLFDQAAESTLSPARANGIDTMKIKIPKRWLLRQAPREEGHTISAGHMPKIKKSKRRFRRCNWRVYSKGWQDCGRKAWKQNPTTGLCYCPRHSPNVGCYPRLVPIVPIRD